jgi:peptidyl-dipeptidase A
MRYLFIFIVFLFISAGCSDEKQQAEKILRHYISQKEDLIRNYYMESAVALWNATVSGNENDYQKLVDIELAFNKSNQDASNLFAPDRFYSITQNIFTNEQDFQMLKKLKLSGLITDTLLSRQLNVLYQAFMGPQIETERYQKLMNAEVKLWQAFSGLKVTVDGSEYGSNQIDSLRKNTVNTEILKQIFEAYRQQGQKLAPDIVKMVNDRNEFARNFGYTDFYQLSLESKDQTPGQIEKILEEIEVKTRDQFFEAKRVIDKLLTKKYNLSPGELRPWLYNDERISYLPEKFRKKMDSLFADIDPVKKAESFFAGIGSPVADVFANSDLEYRPNKSSVTAMINVDFKNDIRLISSIQHTHEGMVRMMHLGGHASHYKSISDQVPYLLKTPNYALGEGVARYYESLASNYNWLKSAVLADTVHQKQLLLVCEHLLQVDRLFRCRRLLTMAHFEREIYRNPSQNLDKLWYDLNLKYMGLNYDSLENSSSWAANKFATSLACNTHNLVLADVFAAQLQHAIESRVIQEGNYLNNDAIGEYLKVNLYQYGNTVPWEKLIEKATGEPLNTAYFVNYLVGEQHN